MSYDIDAFTDDMLAWADALLLRHGIEIKKGYDDDRTFYHYSSRENILNILEKGQIRFSSIRNMSDPLEFVLQFSIAKDFLVKIFEKSGGETKEIRNFFIQEMKNSTLMPYVFCVSEIGNSKKLIDFYGDGRLSVRFTSKIDDAKGAAGFLVKIQYLDLISLRGKICEVIGDFINSFDKEAERISLSKGIKLGGIHGPKSIVMMKVLNILACSLKLDTYRFENEWRLVLFMPTRKHEAIHRSFNWCEGEFFGISEDGTSKAVKRYLPVNHKILGIDLEKA